MFGDTWCLVFRHGNGLFYRGGGKLHFTIQQLCSSISHDEYHRPLGGILPQDFSVHWPQLVVLTAGRQRANRLNLLEALCYRLPAPIKLPVYLASCCIVSGMCLHSACVCAASFVAGFALQQLCSS